MKPETSKQPMNWFPLLVVLVPCLWALSFWTQDVPLAAIATAMTAYLLLESWNLVQARRAAKEAKGLKNDVSGT